MLKRPEFLISIGLLAALALYEGCGLQAGKDTGEFVIAESQLSWGPSLLSVKNGADIVKSPRIEISVKANEPYAEIAFVRIIETFKDCQNQYTSKNWIAYPGANEIINYTVSPSNGPKRICVWVKDNNNAVSQILNHGTPGINTFSFNLDVGRAPSFSSIRVTNGTPGINYGSTNFNTDNVVQIAWTAQDPEGLGESPVDLYYSTDDQTWKTIAIGPNVGSVVGNPSTWTKAYNGFLAPSNSFFKIKLVVRDASGQIATHYSEALNTGKWKIFAGNPTDGTGDSATAATLGYADQNQTGQNIVATSTGDIYIADPRQIRKIDAKTGLISKYILLANNEANIPGVIGSNKEPAVGWYNAVSSANLIVDAQDRIYFPGYPYDSIAKVYLNPRIYRVDTKTGRVEIYAGGGSSVENDIPASDIYLFPSTRMTINKSNGDLYLASPCVFPYLSSNGATDSFQIRKITQNPNGSAGSSHIIAGNCTKGTYNDGDLALNSALEESIYANINGLYFHEPTGALYFWFLDKTPYIRKLINNKLYKIPYHTLLSAAFDVRSQKILVANDVSSYSVSNYFKNMISYIDPSSAEAPDTANTYVSSQSGPGVLHGNCDEDNLTLANSCVRPNSMFNLPDGSVGFADGPMRNAANTSRIRYFGPDNRIHTLAGLKALSFTELDRLSARFGHLRELHYKSSASANQNIFPAGLYFGDGTALAIGRIDLTTGTLSVAGGSQVNRMPTNGTPFSNIVGIGESYSSSTIGYFNFDPNGLIQYSASAYTIKRVDSSGNIQAITSESYGTGFALANNNTNGTSVGAQNYGALLTLVADTNGNYYFGPKYYISPQTNFFPIIGRINVGSNKYNKVLGGLTNSVSPDCSIPGCATSASIKCDFAWSHPDSEANGGGYTCLYNDVYDTANDRLYFAEGHSVRYIEKPHTANQATLGTLFTASRNVWHFLWRPGKDHVYYINSGNLYCYDLSGTNPPECNDSMLVRPIGISPLSPDAMTIDDDGNLYFINDWLQNQIYKFTP